MWLLDGKPYEVPHLLQIANVDSEAKNPLWTALETLSNQGRDVKYITEKQHNNQKVTE